MLLDHSPQECHVLNRYTDKERKKVPPIVAINLKMASGTSLATKLDKKKELREQARPALATLE
jgi:hypothetical protein